jgi:hypothetical protein
VIRRLFPLWLALVCLSGGGAAQAQFALVPGYGDRPAIGPQAARGAIIWNHGRSADGNADFDETPLFLDTLRDAGWDVFRLQRLGSTDTEDGAAGALIGQAEDLRMQGYARIVAAGQSLGGWIAYLAATRTTGLFHAVIANAPAAHGREGRSPNWKLNADRLYAMAEDLRPTRVMTFFFRNDPFDPGGRGRRLGQILDAKGIRHVVVDQRPGLEGHFSGRTLAFARIYDRCIRDFLELPEVPTGFGCKATMPRPVAGDFVLPADSAPARNVPAAAQPFAGRWFGWYTQGREMLLIVRQVSGTRVTAVYAWSALGRQPDEAAGYSVRHGYLDAGAGFMVFDDRGQARIVFSRRRDGQMDVVWTRPEGGGEPLSGTVRKLD